MRQTYKVNIGGFAFSLEDDAFAKCSEYVDSLTRFYENEQDGQEIVENIEQRIAELLLEKCGKDSVVNKEAIDYVIAILGTPEQVEEGSETAGTRKTGYERSQRKTGKFTYNEKRKLFRDQSRSILGGVCSGLSIYFNIDVAAVRLLFAVGAILGISFRLSFLGAFGIHLVKMINMAIPLLYICLWICMPAANSAKERWQLRGADGSLNDIRREMSTKHEYYGNENRSEFWHIVIRIISIFLGIGLLGTALSGILAGLCAIAGIEWFGPLAISEYVPREIAPYLMSTSFSWLKLTVAISYFLPCLGMIYGSVMLIFGLKSPAWHPGLIIFLLWVIALIATIVLVIVCGKNIATPLYFNGMAMVMGPAAAIAA
ncbi:MAG: PspC domain-containing protein [Bacteroidaceae bacterium]|nr:PspC domain-containing protein [Bacteroidaceae bacterium]